MRQKKVSLPHPRAARERMGFSQRQLARLVPTTQCNVWKYEKEGHYPRQVHLRAAYLAALGLVETAEVAP